MVSNVLAAAAILRRHFRRLRYIGLLGTASAVGLIPLVLYMPELVGVRYALLLVVCLYAGRKVVEYFRAHAALKQLSMEENFLRYGAASGSVQKCVENDDHMWTRSRILLGLKAMALHRLPNSMLVNEKHKRILLRYRRAFQKMLPRVGILDLVLLIGVVLLLSLSPTVKIDLSALIFQAGFLALAVAIAAEISNFFVNRQLREGLERLLQTLSDWTIREGLEALSRSDAYSHQLHYFAQPWFAASPDRDDRASDASYEITGDGPPELPRKAVSDDE